MKIVIVAAGLATRLRPLTNFIPKFLVNIGKETGLVAMVNYWHEHSTEFTIIVHSSFIPITQAYWDLYFKDSNLTLTLIACDEAIGTANTITKYLPKDHDGQDLLITWSDVIPGEKIPNIVFQSEENINEYLAIDRDEQWDTYQHYNLRETDWNYIAFGFGNKCRYGYDIVRTERGLEHKIVKLTEPTGDVIGIFQLRNFNRELLKAEIGQDICDVIDNYGRQNFCKLKRLVDYGDMEKLDDLLTKVDGAREFNKISKIQTNGVFNFDNLLFKEARTPQGQALIKSEVDWYNAVSRTTNPITIPKIFASLSYHDDGFFMEEIDGTNVFQMFEPNPLRHEDVLSRVLATLDKLHETKMEVPFEIVARDVKYEAYDKLHTRLTEISGIIDAFGAPTIVNGVEVEMIGDAISYLSNLIEDYYDEICVVDKATELKVLSYSLIHGDPQFSNTMLTPDDKIVFIDPRGYFGKTKNYGLADYDYAKVLYSLSGYDNFNTSKKFHLSYLENGRVGFEIPRPEIAFDINKYFRSPMHYAWLSVIWIGLAQYIKNNPVKSYAALCHGLYLAAKLKNGELAIG